MKRNWIILLGCLLSLHVHALIVSVDGWWDVPAEGMEFMVEEAEEDPLTGEMVMELKGKVLSNGPLTVTITRSAENLADAFCCAGECVTGNGKKNEVLPFTPEGVASWFTHFTPQPNSYTIISYTFTDSVESRTLTVHFNYRTQGVETVESRKSKVESKKILRDGILYIITDNKTYTIL